MAENLDMWYWRDKYGQADALRDYYPDTLAGSDRLKQALAQMENAEAAIDKIMEDLGESNED